MKNTFSTQFLSILKVNPSKQIWRKNFNASHPKSQVKNARPYNLHICRKPKMLSLTYRFWSVSKMLSHWSYNWSASIFQLISKVSHGKFIVGQKFYTRAYRLSRKNFWECQNNFKNHKSSINAACILFMQKISKNSLFYTFLKIEKLIKWLLAVSF